MDKDPHPVVLALGGRHDARRRGAARRVDVAERIVLRLRAHRDGHGNRHANGDQLLALNVDLLGMAGVGTGAATAAPLGGIDVDGDDLDGRLGLVDDGREARRRRRRLGDADGRRWGGLLDDGRRRRRRRRWDTDGRRGGRRRRDDCRLARADGSTVAGRLLEVEALLGRAVVVGVV